MPNVCIRTDSTAQFTQSNFPGHERVHVIPFDLQTNDIREVKPLPGGFAVQKQLIPPSPQEFIQSYTRLSRTWQRCLAHVVSG